jgi:hypothetical protein
MIAGRPDVIGGNRRREYLSAHEVRGYLVKENEQVASLLPIKMIRLTFRFLCPPNI